MVASITAQPVVDAVVGTWNPNPVSDHSGWNNTSGDKAWVPDEFYYRRYLLELAGVDDANIVNWEIYDGTAVPFVDSAATYNAGGVEGDLTPFVNDRATRTIWVRNGTAWGDGLQQPYYDNTGQPLISALRANGRRIVIELPAYNMKWDSGVGPAQVTFEVEAFLPGSFGNPTATASVVVNKPNPAHIGNETGAVQPRDDDEPQDQDEPCEDQDEIQGEEVEFDEGVELEPLPEIDEENPAEERVSKPRKRRGKK